MTFPGFFWNSSFLIFFFFFAGKSISEIHKKTRRKSGEGWGIGDGVEE